MKVVVPKITKYHFAFILCVIIPYFDNFELTFAVWSLVAAFTIVNNYSYTFIKQVACYFTILVISFTVHFYYDYSSYYVIRDITYMLKPILGLLIGYQLCKKSPNNNFELISLAGFLFAIVHLVFIVRAVIFFKVININELRFYAGFFSDFEVFALVIILFRKKFELNFSLKKSRLYILVIGTSLLLYLARTNFIEFIIILLAMKGVLVINKRSIAIITSLVTLSVLSFFIILYVNPKRNGPGLEAFLYKIKIIPQEAFKTKINRDNWKDLNDNYRSYENIMTVRQVTRDGIKPTLLGQGLGSQIDLKQKIMLGDMELRFISILHNGFMTVFLKSGLLGILFLLFSFSPYFKKSRSEIPIIKQIDLLFIGIGIFMIMSYWVFMGFYFKADNKSILIGMLLCIREIVLKNKEYKND